MPTDLVQVMAALGLGPKCSHRADVVRCSQDSRNIDSAVTTSQSGQIGDMQEIKLCGFADYCS
jgi:hypothetical protein